MGKRSRLNLTQDFAFSGFFCDDFSPNADKAWRKIRRADAGVRFRDRSKPKRRKIEILNMLLAQTAVNVYIFIE
jgi:hypothetical protein